MNTPDISILSDEFLVEVQQMEKKNLALEALKKLLSGEIHSRTRTNVVETKKFSDNLWPGNELMGREVICLGHPFPSFISPSEIFINAHIYMVRRVVLVRLDFSGRAFPTPGEIEITRFIVERCRQIEIDLADHVVISDHGVFSFYKEGLLYLDKKDRPQPVDISLATNRMQ